MSRDYEDAMNSAAPLDVTFQLDPGAVEPRKAHGDDAGYDLATPCTLCIESGTINVLDTHIRVLIPPGYCGLVLPRSSLSARGIACLTGVIDAGYTGTLKITFFNFGKETEFKKGERVAQLVILPLTSVNLIPGKVTGKETARGEGGFGSTGK